MGKRDSVEWQMAEILDMVSDEVREAVAEGGDKASKTSKSELRKVSPDETGDYKRGWRIKKDKKNNDFIVYNAKKPGLTHLLENGHVVVKANGRQSRAPAYKHMEPAEEKGIDVFEETINDELKKL